MPLLRSLLRTASSEYGARPAELVWIWMYELRKHGVKGFVNGSNATFMWKLTRS